MNTNHSLETKLNAWSPKSVVWSIMVISYWITTLVTSANANVSVRSDEKSSHETLSNSNDGCRRQCHSGWSYLLFRLRLSYLFCIILNSFLLRRCGNCYYYHCPSRVGHKRTRLSKYLMSNERASTLLLSTGLQTTDRWLSQFASPKPCRRGHWVVCYYFIVRSFLPPNTLYTYKL